MLITDKEVQTWSENQVEYVRQQVDYTNNWNVKRTNQDLIKAICNIRPTRKVKISNYLTGFLNIIVESMTNQQD
jgi:t-SNARE complex subunit (syntaxin)